MILTLSILLAILFTDWPWSLLVIGIGVVLEVAEIQWGRRLARRWKPKAGAETMIGRTAEVVSPLRPVGQVRLDGELWEARASVHASSGERVRIDSVDGLTLVVTPVSPDT